MIRIALIAHLSELSGAGISLVHTAAGLNRQKFSPLLVLPGDGPLLKRALEAGTECHVLPNKEQSLAAAGAVEKVRVAAGRMMYLKSLREFLRAHAIDIAYVNSMLSVFPGIAARSAGTPVVWHVHETFPTPGLGIRTKQRIIERLSAGILYASQSAVVAFPASRVPRKLVVRNFVDVRALADAPHGDIRRKFGLAYDERIILMSGFRYSKGTDVFLEAAKIVADTMPEKLRYIVLGHPASKTESAGLLETAERVAPGRFLFPGLRENPASFIKSADVLVSPSRSESLPGILVEAMAAGTPVVATDVGDCALLLDHGRLGRVVPTEDPPALAQAIIDLLHNPQSAKKLAIMAQEKVLREYSPENFWNPLESFLESVVHCA